MAATRAECERLSGSVSDLLLAAAKESRQSQALLSESARVGGKHRTDTILAPSAKIEVPKNIDAQTRHSNEATRPALPHTNEEPFEASDAAGHLVSKGQRIKMDNGNYTKTGEWTYYFSDGEPRERGTFANDMKSGDWVEWDEQAQNDGKHRINQGATYDHGIQVARTTYRSGGQVRAHGPILPGTEDAHGLWHQYYKNGAVMTDELMNGGGVVSFTLYDQKGKVIGVGEPNKAEAAWQKFYPLVPEDERGD